MHPKVISFLTISKVKMTSRFNTTTVKIVEKSTKQLTINPEKIAKKGGAAGVNAHWCSHS